MPAEAVRLQFLQRGHQSGPQWIEMDIADQFQKIRLLLAKDRFVPILEKVSMTAVAAVEADPVSGQEPSHDGGDGGGAGLQQKMEMVGDQSPSITASRCLGKNRTHPGDEIFAIQIITENLAAFQAAADDMLESAGGVYTSLSGHGVTMSQPPIKGNA